MTQELERHGRVGAPPLGPHEQTEQNHRYSDHQPVGRRGLAASAEADQQQGHPDREQDGPARVEPALFSAFGHVLGVTP